jgi:1-phosphofructokinase family hexose kinase
MKPAVLIVSPNTAIDSYYAVADFLIGDINRASLAIHTAGGKGINVARALRILGHEARCVGLVGGTSGRFIRQELRREGIGAILVDSGSETRRTATIVNLSTGGTTVVADPGPAVTEASGQRLFDASLEAARGARYVALVGSLPVGLQDNFYAELVLALHKASPATICVDGAGAALLLAMKAGPALVKVNRSELISALGADAGASPEAMANVSLSLAGDGVEILIVTDGSRGSYVFSRGTAPFRVVTRLEHVVSAVGAGDTFLAGLIATLDDGAGIEEATIAASAASAANVLQIGCGTLDVSDARRLISQTRLLRPISFEEDAA